MQTFKSFPDLGRSMAKFKLQFALDEIRDNSILGLCIQAARMNGTPLETIARNVYESYLDNPDRVLTIVPQTTIDLIKSIYYAEK